MKFIPVNEPLLGETEKRYLNECVETGWISSEGPFVRRFEEEVAGLAGRKHGVAVSSGSAALDVAVAALGIGAGDEVVLPTFTIISCAAAIVRAGAVPVVVDCDPRTWNMDVAQVESRISPRTKAIMPVHIYGLPVDMEPILSLADRYGLFIIEDAAQAQGQAYRGRQCGSFGDVSVFSFYPNKHITTGEGGMVLTDDADLADRCRSLRNLCFQKKRFVHEELGWNFRMSNLQAAVGLAQAERLEETVCSKRRIGGRYAELLAGLPFVQLPVSRTEYADNIYWVYGVVLDDDCPLDSDSIMKALAAHDIGTRPFFWPMHEQPVFRKMGLFRGESCPHAERLARRGFYLPSGLALEEGGVVRVAESLWKVLAK